MNGFIPSSLHNNDPFTWSTAAPLIALVAIVTIAVLCICCARYLKDYEFAPFEGDTYENSAGSLVMYANSLHEEEDDEAPGRHTFACLLLLCLLIFIILLLLRITQTTETSFALVFIPFFIAAGLMCFLPAVQKDDSKKYQTCAKIWLGVVCPVLVFCILLVLRLEGTDIQISLVLLPMFLLNILICCGMCLISDKNLEDRVPGCLAVSALLSPILVFEILVAIYFDDPASNISFTTMVIPLFILESVVALICCGADSLVMFALTEDD